MPAANQSLFQMRILNIVFLLSLCGLLNVKAQEETVVISSRAGRSTGVDVMPFRSLQLESRIEYDHGECEQVLLPGMMLRYGITKLAEIWVEYTGFYGNESDVFAYQVNPIALRVGNHRIGGFLEAGLGYKGFLTAGVSLRF